MFTCCGNEYKSAWGLAVHKGQKHQVPTAEINKQYPSTQWGEKEWVTLLTVRGDIFDRILRDIGRGGCRRRTTPNI